MLDSSGFCTIITNNYLPYILSLNESLVKYCKDIRLNVLISDSIKINTNISWSNIKIFDCNVVCAEGTGYSIQEKYKSSDVNKFRWSLKSIFIKYLLENENYDKIIYVDSDIFFFNDFKFLFDALDKDNIILTPHWRSSDPHKDTFHFELLFTDGLFNAGFIGVNKNAIDAMEWWATMCLYECKKDYAKGLYDDQAYLNLFPILFDKVHILKHKGCNVANWNQVDCPRICSETKAILIDNQWPIVFIHFTKCTIEGILSGQDILLKPFLEEYLKTLKKHGINLSISANKNHHNISQNDGNQKSILIRIIKGIWRRSIFRYFISK